MSIINVNEIGPISLGSTVTFTAGSTVKVSNLSGNSNTITIPSGQTLIGEGTITPRYLDIPYANLARVTGYTVASGGWSDITWTSIVTARYITATASSANIQFQYPGTYRISVGWRFGVGGDVWTSLRLVDSGTQRGLGYGTGQVLNDPGPCEIGMVATIPSNRVNQNMTIQFYRGASTMAIGNPDAGYAVNCIINYIGV